MIVVSLAALTRIDVRGMKVGADTAVTLVVAEMLPLVLFVVVGLFFVDWSRVTAFEAPPSSTLAQAALLLPFACAGFENTPAAAGESKNPQRDVPSR